MPKKARSNHPADQSGTWPSTTRQASIYHQHATPSGGFRYLNARILCLLYHTHNQGGGCSRGCTDCCIPNRPPSLLFHRGTRNVAVLPVMDPLRLDKLKFGRPRGRSVPQQPFRLFRFAIRTTVAVWNFDGGDSDVSAVMHLPHRDKTGFHGRASSSEL